MPPRKKAAASPAASKRAAAKKRQGTLEKAKEPATAPTAEAVGGGAATGGVVGSAATAEGVAGPPGKGEKADGSKAAARPLGQQDDLAVAVVEGTGEAAAAVVAADCGDGSVPKGKEEVNGSVGREEVVKMEVEDEELASAAAAAGVADKGQDAHVVAAEVEKSGEAEASAAAVVDGGDTGRGTAEDVVTKGDIGGNQEEEAGVSGLTATEEGAAVQVKVELAAPDAPSSRAAPDAFPAASAVAKLPALLPLQITSRNVNELRGLSKALSGFICCWDELSHHLDSIQASMDTLSGVLDGWALAQEGKQQQDKLEEEEEEEEEEETDKKTEAGGGEMGKKGDKDTDGAEQTKKPGQLQKTSPQDLNSICEKMLGRNLRKYVVAHISELDRLREEVPKALRLAPDPARLVLSCIGRFYLQGSRAYADPNSPMVCVRRACILVLEFFLASGCAFSGSGHLSSSPSDATATNSAPTGVADGKEPPTSVMEEAKVAALAWKNRLVAEGGVASASAVDALGLALFVASFGIPPDFDSEMLYDVFRLCNMKKKADVLCQSPVIVEKLPDIIQDLVQKEKYIAAADLACGFGLQDKYPPLDLISSFLIKTKTDGKEEKREGQFSMRSLKEATENQLAAYKSVAKCLEDHKLDPSSLGRFKIKEKISKLERDIIKFENRLKDKNLKRKAEDVKLANQLRTPAKHPTTFGGLPSRVNPTQDHGGALSLSTNLHNGSSNRYSGMLDGGGLGNPAGSMGTNTFFTGSGYSVGNSVQPSVDSRGVSYRWFREGALGDSSVGHSYVGMGHPGHRGLMGPLPMENSLQPPASPVGTGSRATTASSLYGFADNVLENEFYYSHSVRSNAQSNPPSGYHSSYLN